ncbi:MAG: 2Fe-2S iron-sulfur cluster binding domain-containing protein [Deltaproteobacteria bacterium]|nr:2Fe-2S iron-sulfur cluster binding domain-containing protein [Deltaproteobacteria bacterium]
MLEAARQAGIRIPTLCHHEALEPYGGCRLCVVDVTRPEWDGWNKLVVACLYPVEDGLIVHTDTERVMETRRVVLDLLLARSPNTPLIRDLAREYGIDRTSYEVNPEPTDCILCGLCTRVCDHIGVSAISAANRGAGREIAPPFMEDAPPDCIGCLACAEVCPTDHITYTQTIGTRTIWGKTFEMLRCPECGRAHITREQAAFEARRNKVPESYFEYCDECKRKKTAGTIRGLSRTG